MRKQRQPVAIAVTCAQLINELPSLKSLLKNLVVKLKK